jgi:hypothetical protein
VRGVRGIVLSDDIDNGRLVPDGDPTHLTSERVTIGE